MTTLERLQLDAAQIQEALKRGETVTGQQLETLKIFNRWKGGKAGNAGKRSKTAENNRLIKGK